MAYFSSLPPPGYLWTVKASALRVGWLAHPSFWESNTRHHPGWPGAGHAGTPRDNYNRPLKPKKHDKSNSLCNVQANTEQYMLTGWSTGKNDHTYPGGG